MKAKDLTAFTDLLAEDLTDPTPEGHGGSSSTLVGLLRSARPAGTDDEAVLDVLVAAVRLLNLVTYLVMTTVATAVRCKIPLRRRLKTGADLLLALGVAPSAAYRLARVARASESLPTVVRGMRDGAVSVEKADAIGKGVERIGKRVELSDDDRTAVINSLSAQADPVAVDRRARELALKLAPVEPEEGAVPVAENTELNEMTLTQSEEGRTTASLDLDAVTGEELTAALDPLCRPVPQPDGANDPRSAKQRRADAFGQIVRTYLSHSERPTSGGVLPHVSLIVPTGTDPATLGYTGPISATTASLIECDAVIGSVSVDGKGVPLNVNTGQRLFSPKLRKALTVRDGGCAFPGCGRPPSWCDAHHAKAWADGGETCLDNGVLLCRMHHTLVHQSSWEVFIGEDRHPWFLPPVDPKRPDVQRKPIRSHNRRTITTAPDALGATPPLFAA